MYYYKNRFLSILSLFFLSFTLTPAARGPEGPPTPPTAKEITPEQFKRNYEKLTAKAPSKKFWSGFTKKTTLPPKEAPWKSQKNINLTIIIDYTEDFDNPDEQSFFESLLHEDHQVMLYKIYSAINQRQIVICTNFSFIIMQKITMAINQILQTHRPKNPAKLTKSFADQIWGIRNRPYQETYNTYWNMFYNIYETLINPINYHCYRNSEYTVLVPLTDSTMLPIIDLFPTQSPDQLAKFSPKIPEGDITIAFEKNKTKFDAFLKTPAYQSYLETTKEWIQNTNSILLKGINTKAEILNLLKSSSNLRGPSNLELHKALISALQHFSNNLDHEYYIFLAGHGSTSQFVCGLPSKAPSNNFQKLLLFFKNSMIIKVLTLQTCYLGGTDLNTTFNAQHAHYNTFLESLPYTIIIQGLFATSTSTQISKYGHFSFNDYFEKLHQKKYPDAGLLLSSEIIQQVRPANLINTTAIRYANTSWFLPLNTSSRNSRYGRNKNAFVLTKAMNYTKNLIQIPESSYKIVILTPVVEPMVILQTQEAFFLPGSYNTHTYFLNAIRINNATNYSAITIGKLFLNLPQHKDKIRVLVKKIELYEESRHYWRSSEIDTPTRTYYNVYYFTNSIAPHHLAPAQEYQSIQPDPLKSRLNPASIDWAKLVKNIGIATSAARRGMSPELEKSGFYVQLNPDDPKSIFYYKLSPLTKTTSLLTDSNITGRQLSEHEAEYMQTIFTNHEKKAYQEFPEAELFRHERANRFTPKAKTIAKS